MSIGASVLGDQLLDKHEPSSAEVLFPTERLPSLLRSVTDSHRVLLRGPDNSDISSLVLDLALSLASEQPCRCRSNRCEGCVAVSMLVWNDPNAEFPKLCSPDEASAPLSETIDKFQPSAVQKRVLQRIQIRHINSLNDIMHYCLSVTGVPEEELPLGGILIDGLDRFVNSATQDAASMAIQMSQIAAVLADAVSCLHKLYTKKPIILISLSDDPKYRLFSTTCKFWSPDVLTIEKHNTSHKHSNDEVVLHSWKIQSTVYSILQNLDQEQRIVWSETKQGR